MACFTCRRARERKAAAEARALAENGRPDGPFPRFKRGIDTGGAGRVLRQARYDGRCRVCQKYIYEGDPIAAYDGSWVHPSCAQEVD